MALLIVTIGALVMWVNHRRWPQNGIEYQTIVMARQNLSHAPTRGPSIALADLREEAIAAMAGRMAERAAVHDIVSRRAALSTDRVASGVAHALEILTRRADPDPEAYLRWAKGRGCTINVFRTPSFLVGPDGEPIVDIYDHAHRWTFHAPMPPGMTPERFVVEMLRATKTVSGGRAWARSVLTDERSLFVEVSIADRRSHGFEYSMLDRSGLGSAFWYGSIGDRREHMLICGPSLDDVVKRDGHAVVMRVMLAAMSANNKPIPLTFEMYHDPYTDRWLAHAITMSNMHENFPYTAF